MKRMEYKFLDEYVGEFFSINVVGKTPLDRVIQYEIVSDNGKRVLYFWVRDEHIKLFRSDELCKTVSCFFCVDPEESMRLVRDWFGDKLGLKKVSDLLELLPKE